MTTANGVGREEYSHSYWAASKGRNPLMALYMYYGNCRLASAWIIQAGYVISWETMILPTSYPLPLSVSLLTLTPIIRTVEHPNASRM